MPVTVTVSFGRATPVAESLCRRGTAPLVRRVVAQAIIAVGHGPKEVS
jgi:hypothetical protein